jgi:hypothetical protein
MERTLNRVSLALSSFFQKSLNYVLYFSLSVEDLTPYYLLDLRIIPYRIVLSLLVPLIGHAYYGDT